MADSLFDLGLPDDEDRVKFIAPTPRQRALQRPAGGEDASAERG